MTVVFVIVCGIFIFQVKTTNEISAKLNEPSGIDYLVDELVESGVVTSQLNLNDPILKQRKIFITHSINEYISNDVINKLLFLDSQSHIPIDLYICTNGGWGISAFAIIETMKMIASPVNTIAFGMCYSSGVLILVSATGKRFATEKCILMIHCNLDSSKNDYSFEQKYKKLYEGVWKSRTNIPIEWYPMTSDKSYYLNAEEALKFNIIDEIIIKE